MLAATGPVEFERNLQTGDQLRMWAVAIDQKGVPVAPFIISETYTVEENTAALAEVSIDSYAWYDGAELAQLDPINFAGFEEYAVLLLKVSHNDKAAHWWTGCFMGDLSNPDEYSDRSIINNLVTYGIPEFKDAVDQLLAVYWDENTICSGCRRQLWTRYPPNGKSDQRGCKPRRRTHRWRPVEYQSYGYATGKIRTSLK